MTISPDLKYLERTDFNPFEKKHYLKRDSKYSGYIFYHDMNGNFVICTNTYLLWEIETCYGTDYGNYQIINTIEPYAANVYDRDKAAEFLINYPPVETFQGPIFPAGDLTNTYQNAIYAFNKNSNTHGAAYIHNQYAVALAYVMDNFDMGVTLSRRANNGNFEFINAQNTGTSTQLFLDIAPCP
jgi:hypothetical protein